MLLIIIDTLRADAIGAYSGDAEATPNLDRLARDGVRFANTYSQATWTRPSIATILTSLYPSVHGAEHKFDALPDRVTTLAEALRADGYWTSGFVSNINVAPVFNFQQGFDEYDYVAPSFYFWATDSATRLAIYKGLRVLRERFFGSRIYFYNYAQDSAVVNGAVFHWLDQRPPNPFFLWVHYMDAHDPYFEIPYNGRGVARVTDPDPPAARAPELHKLYGEDVHYLDEQLGHLFEHLQAAGAVRRHGDHRHRRSRRGVPGARRVVARDDALPGGDARAADHQARARTAARQRRARTSRAASTSRRRRWRRWG